MASRPNYVRVTQNAVSTSKETQGATRKKLGVEEKITYKKKPQQRVCEDADCTYLEKLNSFTSKECYMLLQGRLKNTH
jgi:hypothetical protein